MKQGQEINIDVRLPFLTDLLCDTICQVVAGPDNSPGIGQPLSGLWPLNQKWKTFVKMWPSSIKGEVASWSGQLGSYVEDVKCYTIVEQRIKLILSWVRSVSEVYLWLFFRRHWSLRLHFYLLLGLWKFKRFCKGRCHLRFSGIRPLRGYPPPPS